MAEKKERKESEESRSVTPWRTFGDWPSLWEGFPARSRLLDELFREWPQARRAGAQHDRTCSSSGSVFHTIAIRASPQTIAATSATRRCVSSLRRPLRTASASM